MVKRYHTKQYTVNYMKRHLAQGHSLYSIVEHIKDHVKPDVLHDALEEIHLSEYDDVAGIKEAIKNSVKIQPHNKEVAHDQMIAHAATARKRPTQQGSFLSEFRIYEYLIVILFIGLTAIALFSDVWVTFLLLASALWVGLAWSGSFKIAQYGFIGTLVIAGIALYTQSGFELAFVSTVLGAAIFAVLVWSRYAGHKEPVKH